MRGRGGGTEGGGEGGPRRKRISSISQRVAVTVSVMAFGSVVGSYSCANPISALLRVYIFSHTRHLRMRIYTRRRCARTRACVNAPTKKERDGKVTNISSHYPHIEFLLFTHININIYVMEKTKIKKDTRDVDGRKSSRCNFHECTFRRNICLREKERELNYTKDDIEN